MTTYPYPVTVHTDDPAVLHALRGLVHYCQKRGSDKMKAWAETGREEWERDGHRVTFHFSSPGYLESFLDEAGRLLPGRWSRVPD